MDFIDKLSFIIDQKINSPIVSLTYTAASTPKESSNSYTFVSTFCLKLEFLTKNTLVYIRTIFSGCAWLLSETTGSEHLK